MFIGILSVLAVVSIILRNFLRPSPKKSEVSMDDLKEFNSSPPLQSELLEAESKGMLDKKFPHNYHVPPVYNLSEMVKIIKTFSKRVKKPEHEFNEYQRNHVTNLINTEKMYQILRFLCHQKFETVSIRKGNNSGPRAISLKVFGSQDQFKKVRKEVQENLIQEYT